MLVVIHSRDCLQICSQRHHVSSFCFAYLTSSRAATMAIKDSLASRNCKSLLLLFASVFMNFYFLFYSTNTWHPIHFHFRGKFPWQKLHVNLPSVLRTISAQKTISWLFSFLPSALGTNSLGCREINNQINSTKQSGFFLCVCTHDRHKAFKSLQQHTLRTIHHRMG